jgi:hypothetical protein
MGILPNLKLLRSIVITKIMSSYKLYIAVSTYIRQKTLFPRCNLAYSDFLGQTSVSRNTIIAATYKLFLEAEKRWKPLRGKNRITQVINMEKFIDGIHVSEISNDNLNEKKYVA